MVVADDDWLRRALHDFLAAWQYDAGEFALFRRPVFGFLLTDAWLALLSDTVRNAFTAVLSRARLL